eukprot:gb/GECG01002288.1/.p1 GENE.gb/GECG01002288.1/~~gb/GECG01002288.1/.p1  ORF type:complete len:281 (+),score=27.66 gb/GECG01002288.1/:1-843(+)
MTSPSSQANVGSRYMCLHCSINSHTHKPTKNCYGCPRPKKKEMIHNMIRRVGGMGSHTSCSQRRGIPSFWVHKSLFPPPTNFATLQRRSVHTVYATDPRFIIDEYHLRRYDDELRGETGSRAFLKLELTDQLYEDLQQHKMEFKLADGDDPGNFYILGKHGELFEYDFLGSHSALSGLTAIVDEETAEDAIVNAATVSTNPEEWDMDNRHMSGERWEKFYEQVLSTMKAKTQRTVTVDEHPEFLFIGQVLHAPSMAVYTLGKGEQQRGIMLHSEDNAEED